MKRLAKQGLGWRLGWNPEAVDYQGLVGGDDWAIELTGEELEDFCRLLAQLAQTISQMASELMDEEQIACEAQTDLMWMQVEGFPSAYSLHFILNTGRGAEGSWNAQSVTGLLPAAASLKVF
jgi:Domain of unknown function (DUF1818)